MAREKKGDFNQIDSVYKRRDDALAHKLFANKLSKWLPCAS